MRRCAPRRLTVSVSRETPPAPSLAREVFSECLPPIELLSSWLTGPGTERGLLGPREAPRIWERHLINCGVVAPHLPEHAQIADVGSGAGLPGLVWAVSRPDLTVTLIEPLLRRATFLSEVVGALGLDARVEVVRARAEDLHGTSSYEIVTARAVAHLDKLARWCLPLVSPGGELWALKGSSAQAEMNEASATLRSLKGTNARLTTYGESILEVPTRVVKIDKH